MLQNNTSLSPAEIEEIKTVKGGVIKSGQIVKK